MKAKAFLAQLDHDRIVAAIGDAEGRSHGEVRVHVSSRSVDDAQTAAAHQFDKLGMSATALRNGVLIYVAPKSQRFAVIGDRGIHERAGPEFWREVAAAMQDDFRHGRFTDGIVSGVTRAGELLARYFPRGERADVNELPDQVSHD